MATEALKILAQMQPGDTADNLLYTVPASTEVVAQIRVSNNTANQRTYRIGLTNTGATPVLANGEYQAYDTPIPSGDVHVHSGITLDAADRIYAQSDAASSLSFGVFGTEVT
jgi:hypothetical protein